MKLILSKIIKTLFSALLGKKMLFWGLEFAAKQTDNLVDDTLVNLAKTADSGDIEATQEALKDFTESLADMIKEK
jgi:hypothetical protein